MQTAWNYINVKSTYFKIYKHKNIYPRLQSIHNIKQMLVIKLMRRNILRVLSDICLEVIL